MKGKRGNHTGLSLKMLDEKIQKLEDMVIEARNEGTNMLATQGKFDNLFGTIQDINRRLDIMEKKNEKDFR